MGQTHTQDCKHSVDKDKNLKEKRRAVMLAKVSTKKTITGVGRQKVGIESSILLISAGKTMSTVFCF